LKKLLLLSFLFLSPVSLSVLAQTTPPAVNVSSSASQNPRPGFPTIGFAATLISISPPRTTSLTSAAAPSRNPPRPAAPIPSALPMAVIFLSGYVELQPLNRTFVRHLFFFFDPTFTFGNNIPQLKYTYSMEPMVYDRSIGVGFKLPRRFEFRFVQHQVDWLGRYSKNLGPADLNSAGPYGLYSTVGVRWNFGGYGASSSSGW